MTNLESILESRDITLPTKVHLVKALVFPVVMYRCELCLIPFQFLKVFTEMPYFLIAGDTCIINGKIT